MDTKPIIVVLVGESASGKSTIEKLIEERDSSFTKIISYTTRPPREGEKNNVDYHFVSIDDFLFMIKLNVFIENAQYRGWHYGTARDHYFDEKNHIVVLTPHGCRSLKKWAQGNPYIKVISIYFKVDRRSRMIKILKRGDDIDEAYRRNISDVGQFDGFEDEADYTLENTNYEKPIEEVYKEVRKIIDECYEDI